MEKFNNREELANSYVTYWAEKSTANFMDQNDELTQKEIDTEYQKNITVHTDRVEIFSVMASYAKFKNIPEAINCWYIPKYGYAQAEF